MENELPKDFYKNNRIQLLKKVNKNSIVLVFSGNAPHRSNDTYYPFEVNRNFYYLTGIERENLVYMAVRFQDQVEEFLFVEKGDPVLEKWVGKKITPQKATEISGVKSVFYYDYLSTKVNSLFMNARINIEHIYVDFDRYSWDDPLTLGGEFYLDVHKKYPYLQCHDLSKLLIPLRYIKNSHEVSMIKKAIDITNEGIKSLMSNAEENIYEYQLEAFFDFTIKSKGAKLAFDTISASGKNATILHYVQNNQIIQNNSLILFDLGARVNNYCADISRTFPVNGKFSDRQREIYSIVLNCMKEVIKMMQPGKSMIDINKFAKDFLAKSCKNIGLIDNLEEITKYYYHSIGHSLGLNTHDVGDRDIVLQPGMVYTCEPGLYIEEEGIGIRIEDDILITENGNINLSEHIIKEIDDIENFMQK